MRNDCHADKLNENERCAPERIIKKTDLFKYEVRLPHFHTIPSSIGSRPECQDVEEVSDGNTRRMYKSVHRWRRMKSSNFQQKRNPLTVHWQKSAAPGKHTNFGSSGTPKREPAADLVQPAPEFSKSLTKVGVGATQEQPKLQKPEPSSRERQLTQVSTLWCFSGWLCCWRFTLRWLITLG